MQSHGSHQCTTQQHAGEKPLAEAGAQVGAVDWFEQDAVALAAPAEAGAAHFDALVAATVRTGWEVQPESCCCYQGGKSQDSVHCLWLLAGKEQRWMLVAADAQAVPVQA